MSYKIMYSDFMFVEKNTYFYIFSFLAQAQMAVVWRICMVVYKEASLLILPKFGYIWHSHLCNEICCWYLNVRLNGKPLKLKQTCIDLLDPFVFISLICYLI